MKPKLPKKSMTLKNEPDQQLNKPNKKKFLYYLKKMFSWTVFGALLTLVALVYDFYSGGIFKTKQEKRIDKTIGYLDKIHATFGDVVEVDSTGNVEKQLICDFRNAVRECRESFLLAKNVGSLFTLSEDLQMFLIAVNQTIERYESFNQSRVKVLQTTLELLEYARENRIKEYGLFDVSKVKKLEAAATEESSVMKLEYEIIKKHVYNLDIKLVSKKLDNMKSDLLYSEYNISLFECIFDLDSIIKLKLKENRQILF